MEWFTPDPAGSSHYPKNADWPLVSIVTVNYNQSGVTMEFLKSLRGCTYQNLEVFVVDNGSPNDNPLKIASIPKSPKSSGTILFASIRPTRNWITC